MSQNNEIKIDGNGNILLQDINNSTITIDTSDATKMMAQLEQLSDSVLDTLSQIADKEENINTLFKTILSGVLSQKNIVKGSISNVKGDVNIGDNNTRVYNYYTIVEQTKTSKDLTAKVPKLRANQIVGRANDLKDLHDRLFDNRQIVLVNGMGGIGKTTLAQVYVTEYYEQYKHIAWISLLTGNVEEDFINSPGLLTRFKINETGKLAPDLFNELIMAMKELNDYPCLLVLDNAESKLGNYFDYLPAQPDWHVLVTSRENIPNFDLKELGFLKEPDAILLFQQHYKRGKLKIDFLKTLVNALDLHTLTIEILAKTAQEQRTPPDVLLQALEEDLEADVSTRHNETKIQKITSYLSSIFAISKLSEDEQWLLLQLSFLPSEFHSFELLEELIQPKKSNKEQLFPKLLTRLSSKGWLLYQQSTDSYKLHRIIIDVVKKQLTEKEKVENLSPLITAITDKLSIDYSKDNPIDKFKWIPYGKAILNRFPKSTATSMASLQNNLAGVLKDFGDYQGAKALFEKATKSAELNFGPDHPTTAVRYSNLALLLRNLMDYQGAKALFEKATKSAELNFGPDHPTTAVSYSNLATVLQVLGDYQGAKTLLEKATKSDELNFGPDHPNTAVSYSNLAVVLQDLGDYQGAKELLEKAKKSYELNFGPDHPSTARTYSNLALVLKDLGDYQGAKELLEKAKKSAELNFGPDHPTTAGRYSNLASVLLEFNNYKEAMKLLEKAHQVYITTLGANHPYTISVQGWIERVKQLIDK